MTKADAIIQALRAQRDQALDSCALLAADLAEARAQLAELQKRPRKKKPDQPAQ